MKPSHGTNVWPCKHGQAHPRTYVVWVYQSTVVGVVWIHEACSSKAHRMEGCAEWGSMVFVSMGNSSLIPPICYHLHRKTS